MAVTFNAVSRAGAYRQYSHGAGLSPKNSYNNASGSVGWAYESVYFEYAGLREFQGSYDAAALFEGELPAVVEPASEDAPVIQATVTLAGAISTPAAVGIISGQISDTLQTRYNQLRTSSNVIGTISAGNTSGTFTLTRAQAVNALAYGIKVFPAIEFGSDTSFKALNVSETRIVYAANNPAARGRISDLSPGNYSSIVMSAANTISYTYHHDAGGYAQAYLSVIAENQDTGETVTICRKQAVSVADGARGSFTIPADTLGEGRWTLTVCAAPSASASYYGDSSDFWTTGQTFTYVVRENPSTSVVTCDGKPVPTVSWSSSGQAAYQVRFGDYDSGARVGSATSFTVPKIFRDGAYPVQVRTATSAGNWSAWTDVEYAEIANAEPSGTFSAVAAQDGVNAVISWTGSVAPGNLADGVAVTNGKYINYSTGAEGSSSNAFCTDYIDISQCTEIEYSRYFTTSSSSTWGIFFYDSGKTPISGSGIRASLGSETAHYEMETAEVPDGAHYIRLSGNQTLGPVSLYDNSGSISAAHYAVFRDGEMIAVTDSGASQYVDRIGAGGEYEVLAVTSGNYYKSSGPLPMRLRLAADLISADGGYTWLACRLTPERKSQPEDIREDVTFAYYAGADKPAAFRTHRKQRTKTFSFIFFSRAAARTLKDLVGREVAVKTTRGEHILGVIGEMSWGDGRQITASFSVREVRGEEDGIEYPA